MSSITAATSPSSTPKTRRCYLRLEADGVPQGRLEFQLHSDRAPMTVANFVALCGAGAAHDEGSKNSPARRFPYAYGYKGSRVHRVIPGFGLQAGDFQCGDGTGGWSVYGRDFPDEDFSMRHDKAGVLSMANSGPNTNGSQFIVTLAPCPWMDGCNVAFGELHSGWDVLKRLEDFGSASGRPTKRLIIVDCGEVNNN